MQEKDSKAKSFWQQFLGLNFSANKKAIVFGSIALSVALVLFTQYRSQLKRTAALAAIEAAAIVEEKALAENTKYDLDLRNFEEKAFELKSGDALGPILNDNGVSHEDILKITENAKGVFDIGNFRAGKSVHFYISKSEQKPAYLIYNPSPYEYVSIQLVAPFEVKVNKRPVETRMVEASGVLQSSLWKTMNDNGLSNAVADEMIQVLESSVDFYHQQKGDRFKLIFEEHYVDGEAVGVGAISVALYERGDEKSYAFRYAPNGDKFEYFDEEGRPARKAFLKAPVKFSRISSRFSKSRFHPVLRYSRPHLGTDYAAPRGTPILAVSSGTVKEATRRGGNGNYVRIYHDGTYESQYLHMSGFAKGIRPGTSVQQGQVIGYVGSTGLATGPHVCFRFWKNGKQVDFLKQKLPVPEPMTTESLPAFLHVRDSLMQKLDGVLYKVVDENEADNSDFENPIKA